MRAELLEPAQSLAPAGYREGARNVALPTLRLSLRAGLPPWLTMLLLLVWLALLIAATTALSRLGIPARGPTAILVYVGPGLVLSSLVLWLTRDRRIELTPTELRVFPPRARSWAAPLTIPMQSVLSLELLRHERRQRPSLDALTTAGAVTLLHELAPVTLEADVPRIFEAYRALVLAGEAGEAGAEA